MANPFVRSFFCANGSTGRYPSLCIQLLSTERRYSVHDLACSLFSEIVPPAAIFSQAITNVINFYFSDSRREDREALTQLMELGTSEAEGKVLAYIREAISKSEIIRLKIYYSPN
jgi:hypothetical protein